MNDIPWTIVPFLLGPAIRTADGHIYALDYLPQEMLERAVAAVNAAAQPEQPILESDDGQPD